MCRCEFLQRYPSHGLMLRVITHMQSKDQTKLTQWQTTKWRQISANIVSVPLWHYFSIWNSPFILNLILLLYKKNISVHMFHHLQLNSATFARSVTSPLRVTLLPCQMRAVRSTIIMIINMFCSGFDIVSKQLPLCNQVQCEFRKASEKFCAYMQQASGCSKLQQPYQIWLTISLNRAKFLTIGTHPSG